MWAYIKGGIMKKIRNFGVKYLLVDGSTADQIECGSREELDYEIQDTIFHNSSPEDLTVYEVKKVYRVKAKDIVLEEIR